VLEKNPVPENVRRAIVVSRRTEGWFTATFFFLFAAVVWIATRGPGAALMKPVVEKLTEEDFVSLSAYVSSRTP